MLYILSLLLIIPIYLLGTKIKNSNVIYYLSFILFIIEIIKQVYLIVNNKWSVWFIPFQLCSMPLYLFLFKKSKIKESYISFIRSYSLLGALAAIFYPLDMINHGLFLLFHSYLFHYLIIMMSANVKEANFLKATELFLIMCIIASFINILFSRFGEINMFYINFKYVNYQPILNKINDPVFSNLIYIMLIILVSYIINKLRNIVHQ